MHQIPKLKCFSTRLAVVFSQCIEAKCSVENEDVVGSAPTGDAPATSEWSRISLPTQVCLILETLQYISWDSMYLPVHISIYWQHLTKPPKSYNTFKNHLLLTELSMHSIIYHYSMAKAHVNYFPLWHRRHGRIYPCIHHRSQCTIHGGIPQLRVYHKACIMAYSLLRDSTHYGILHIHNTIRFSWGLWKPEGWWNIDGSVQ